MDPPDAAVERAFQEWCAMVGVPARETGAPGSYRLARDRDGGVVIVRVGAAAGEVRPVCPPMTAREFCHAVQLVHESMNIKTVQVARSICRRKRRP